MAEKINITFALIVTFSLHCGQAGPPDSAVPATYTQVPGFPTTDSSVAHLENVFQLKNESGSTWTSYVPPSGTGVTMQKVVGSTDDACPVNTGFAPLSEHYNYYHAATDLAPINVNPGETYYARLTYNRETNLDSWYYSSSEESLVDAERVEWKFAERPLRLPTRNRTRTWDTSEDFRRVVE